MPPSSLLLLKAMLVLSSCLPPVSVQIPEEKPGKCPASAPPWALDPCFSRCSTDSSCPGTQKCCLINCGKVCLKPLRPERPGRCPVAPPDASTICPIKCNTDSDCPQPQKCCNFGCMRDCFKPI